MLATDVFHMFVSLLIQLIKKDLNTDIAKSRAMHQRLKLNRTIYTDTKQTNKRGTYFPLAHEELNCLDPLGILNVR